VAWQAALRILDDLNRPAADNVRAKLLPEYHGSGTVRA